MLTAGMEITQDYVWVSIDQIKTARISNDGTFKDRDQPYDMVRISHVHFLERVVPKICIIEVYLLKYYFGSHLIYK